ncbi:probable carboxylesterase 17 [Mangifera indica]|uniref:probable carboxylesterase 17 n=1 Tax=Mangifera indica TaxID=29780 RepID=UPI001CFB028F|nr:probable carboxylesterase 17 [Mangifera indica]
MRSQRMAAVFVDPRLNQPQAGKNNHGVVIEEIEGLIRVYKDGHVERLPAIPNVPCNEALEARVTARDVFIDKYSNLWARVYLPSSPAGKLPFLVYFHGGGFCIGSAAWSCYHEFLSNLAAKAGCVVLSVNYRLAPEHRLPAAYDDGVNTLMWVKQQALKGYSSEQKWWINQCNFSSLFIAGDSAGANTAYNVTTRLGSDGAFDSKPLSLRGNILIQPFFGGETRTASEKHMIQPANSALKLSAADTYWRLSLPLEANRDHPWCNPLAHGAAKSQELKLLPSVMVCISEMDILKDRNVEFCKAVAGIGKKVETVMYKGVGHAFQILHNSQLSQIRIQEMMAHLKAFINQ